MLFIDKLKKIWGWLTPPPARAAEDSPYRELTPVDVEDIATKYRLREEGARLGAGGVPAADAKGPALGPRPPRLSRWLGETQRPVALPGRR